MLTLLFFYLLIIQQIFIIKTTGLKFETSSNALQFIDLENLIGSFHTYAPVYSQLFVRNLGLTDGQEKLLKRYENIQIIPSTYIQTKNIKKINVCHEFILINNTLYDRNNQKKYLFINSIRKQFYLAIVIPFIESQINRLKTNQFYSPCHNHSNSIDLIFYSNQKSIRQFNYSTECYKNIHYISADLSKEEDSYLAGSANMWKKLFTIEQSNPLSLRARGYTHFFLMEPDTRPIRSYWLDAIVEQITNGHNRESYISTKWWMIGSIYRGSIPIENNFLHINGNALYHLSYDFIQFIENVSIEFPYDSVTTNGYDLDLFVYLFKHIDQAKNVWHKFIFTDLIQNCWHSGCNDTNVEFIYNNPNTYLVHGYKIEENKQENYSSKKLYYFILLGIFLVIIRWFRYCCWRICCRRNYADIWKRRFLFR
jgi:hypothetical protein